MIDTALTDWSRLQFALTACYHWIFVPLTLGLSVIMAIMESIYVKKGDPFWRQTAKFWMKLFAINFAVGIATGIILEFEFGTNWSNYSWFVGDIFGAPLAIEGILAFFMEATFFAVMFFGWNKVSKRTHLAATWLTGIGASVSALWILVANAWMQHPDRFLGAGAQSRSHVQVLPFRLQRLDDGSHLCHRRQQLVPAPQTPHPLCAGQHTHCRPDRHRRHPCRHAERRQLGRPCRQIPAHEACRH